MTSAEIAQGLNIALNLLREYADTLDGRQLEDTQADEITLAQAAVEAALQEQRRKPELLWTPENLALLGTMPDKILAKRLGVGRLVPYYKRMALGIPPVDLPEYNRRLRQSAAVAAPRRAKGVAQLRAEADAWIKEQVPALRRVNRAEFKQRLQWLSEGMLRNHLDGVTHYKVDPTEIEVYATYKEKLREPT